MAQVHFDEDTPHLQAYFLPVVNEVKRKCYQRDKDGNLIKEIKKDRNGKDKEVPILLRDKNGEMVYETVKGKFLNNDQFWKDLGGRNSFSKLQDRFNKYITSKGFNLDRGEIGANKYHQTKLEYHINELKAEEKKLNKDLAFKLYDTYGFPIELTKELADELNIEVDVDGFKEKFKAHQELSRKGMGTKFKGGLASTSDINIKYHTATHLLNAALKQVLGSHVHQKGSNITEERMRFDFSHDSKMTPEQIKQTEDLVNKYIEMGLTVTKKEMSKEEAIESGAECMFIDKYPDIVTVYFIGDVSKELCGGPHVNNTNELGHFKITKEEASSAGVRRIKAILE